MCLKCILWRCEEELWHQEPQSSLSFLFWILFLTFPPKTPSGMTGKPGWQPGDSQKLHVWDEPLPSTVPKWTFGTTDFSLDEESKVTWEIRRLVTKESILTNHAAMPVQSFPIKIYLMIIYNIFNSQKLICHTFQHSDRLLHQAVQTQWLAWFRTLACVCKAWADPTRTAFWTEVTLFTAQEIIVLARDIKSSDVSGLARAQSPGLGLALVGSGF